MTGPLGAIVGVVGAGQMGAGIAHAYLMRGADVSVVEPDPAGAQRAREVIARSVERSIAKEGSDARPEDLLVRLRVVPDIGDLPPDADLVIEAVPESVGLKRQVLEAAEKAVSEATVLASNTSSLSITDLGSGLTRSERFLGMHFFNPVPASLLVEVVTGSRTDPVVVEAVVEVVQKLGKQAVVVRDSPGFATSRLGIALGLEAIRMLEDDVAAAADIDRAMVLGYKHPIGPLELTDLVGLDVRLAVAEHLERELGARFAPPALLRRLVAEGKLGKKTGEGFHVW